MAVRKRTGAATKKVAERDLTAELAQLLAKVLLPDLEDRAQQSSVAAALRHQYGLERARERTNDELDDWTRRTLEQIGVAWICLACSFALSRTEGT